MHYKKIITKSHKTCAHVAVSLVVADVFVSLVVAFSPNFLSPLASFAVRPHYLSLSAYLPTPRPLADTFLSNTPHTHAFRLIWTKQTHISVSLHIYILVCVCDLIR